MVPGDETSTVLEGLTQETMYQVSVVAAYRHKDSEPLTGTETTDGKRACPVTAKVSEQTCFHWIQFLNQITDQNHSKQINVMKRRY